MPDMATMSKILDLIFENAEPAWLTSIIAKAENEIIRQRGFNDGKAAGSWVFDGNTSEDQIKRVKQGIEDGDPEILDALPEPRINGEFADDPTFDDIMFEELNWPKGVAYDRDDTGELSDIYTAAFREGVEFEINRS